MEITKRLLMVNDDMVNLESMPSMFVRRGIDLIIVGSVADALQKLKEGRFDFIITDVSLSGGPTGIDLIKEIRKTDKETKIAVATGYGGEYEKEAFAAGANFYFEKPLDLEEHILKPLGIKYEKSPLEAKPAPAKDNKPTLRQAIHEVTNRDNLVIMVSGLLREACEAFVREHNPSGVTRAFIQRVTDDAMDIEDAGKNSDILLKKVRTTVYRKINPDEVVIDD